MRKITSTLLFIALLAVQSVSASANPEKVNTFLESAFKGNIEKMQFQLEKGMDVNAEDAEGNTALFYAIQSDNYESVEYLIESGAETEIVNDNGNSPLTAAVVSKKMNAVKALLANGANPNFTNQNKETALHAAVWHSSSEYVSMLVSYGADVNAETKSGFTPVMLSSLKGDTISELILLKNGAHQKVLAQSKS